MKSDREAEDMAEAVVDQRRILLDITQKFYQARAKLVGLYGETGYDQLVSGWMRRVADRQARTGRTDASLLTATAMIHEMAEARRLSVVQRGESIAWILAASLEICEGKSPPEPVR